MFTINLNQSPMDEGYYDIADEGFVDAVKTFGKNAYTKISGIVKGLISFIQKHIIDPIKQLLRRGLRRPAKSQEESPKPESPEDTYRKTVPSGAPLMLTTNTATKMIARDKWQLFMKFENSLAEIMNRFSVIRVQTEDDIVRAASYVEKEIKPRLSHVGDNIGGIVYARASTFSSSAGNVEVDNAFLTKLQNTAEARKGQLDKMLGTIRAFLNSDAKRAQHGEAFGTVLETAGKVISLCTTEAKVVARFINPQMRNE